MTSPSTGRTPGVPAKAADAVGRQGIADLAVSYVLGHRAISSIALGTVTDDQMRHNLDLAAMEPLSDNEIQRVRELLD